MRELLSEQDELQERLKEIEDTLKLFRTQPAYWDISSLSMARDAVESLWERIELAQEAGRSAVHRSAPICLAPKTAKWINAEIVLNS